MRKRRCQTVGDALVFLADFDWSFRRFMCHAAIFIYVTALLSGVVSAQDPTNARISPENSPMAAEVSIAINPTDIDNMVAGCLMRSYPESNAPNYSFFTRDGGRSWSTVPVGNPDSRTQGDDVVLFSAEGTAVHAYISFVGLWQEFPRRAANGIMIRRSEDGGENWGEQIIVADHLNTKSPMEDKPWLVFDRNPDSPHYNNLYCSWTRFDVYGSDDPQDTTQIVFARSRDGGQSFDPVIRVSDLGGDCVDDDDTVEGAVPAVGPDGTLYVVWAGPRGLEFDKSTDGGKTFGDDKVISDMPGGWAIDIEGINRSNGMPVTAVDLSQGSRRGTLYVNWIDARNEDHDVFLISSPDGGQSWSERVRVNDDDVGNGRDQFFTWMAVDPLDGSVNIAFYDRRETEGTGTRLTLARSVDGGETFKNFEVPIPEFTCTDTVFFGDYIGIDAQQGRVAIAFMHFEDNRELAISSAVYDFQPGTLEYAVTD